MTTTHRNHVTGKLYELLVLPITVEGVPSRLLKDTDGNTVVIDEEQFERNFEEFNVSAVIRFVPTNALGDLIVCQADRDGECDHARCPQILDGEPHHSGRSCPINSTADFD